MINNLTSLGLAKWIEIDLSALRSNVERIKGTLNPGVRLMATVKSNAYGHGLEAVAWALNTHGVCDALGVWSVPEAERILRGCRGKPPKIALLAPILPQDNLPPRLLKAGAWLTLDRTEMISRHATAARRAHAKALCFLDIDLGLGRWGCRPNEAIGLARQAKKNRWIELAGICTHIDYVPGLNRIEAESKLNRFLDMTLEIEKIAGKPLIKTCANSTVLLDFPSWQLDMVRIGNLIYGVNPTSTPFPARNLWTFKARLMSRCRLRRGETVGYGSEFLALKPMTVASVACGFADGLTMEPSNRFISLASPAGYWAKAGDAKLRIVGRVGLGHALLDITDSPWLKTGDEVELPIRRTAASMDIPRIYLK